MDAPYLTNPSNDTAGVTTDDPPAAHNAAADESAARHGRCAQLHLPTGDTCALPRGHEASCTFSPAG